MGAIQTSRTPGIPNGWFAVAFSRDLQVGEVKRIRYFDREMVLFRTREGHARVLDAYCPHLGAHLAEGGRVVGESVRCPFHAWRFDGESGECVEIPYCKRIPPQARVTPWHVHESNHMVFVWHHAEGKPPEWQVPDLPELFDPEWAEPRTFELDVKVHMQDMAENNCDPVHFLYVHTSTNIPPSEISYGENGRFFRMTSTNEQETPLGTFEMTLERDTWGLGLTSVRMIGIPNAGLLMFSSTSPVDENRTHSRWLFTATRNLVDVAGEEFIDGMSRGVMQDMRIWENKIHRIEPVLCEADEYLSEFRKWTRQFYSNPSE
jgi:phenylpropionate dioxygenase-like ring-hydroxylating dioxygenase large terminal subunit